MYCTKNHQRETPGEAGTKADMKGEGGRRLTGPEMVPEPMRSPGRMLQPETEWCASCCFMVQYLPRGES